MKRIIFLIPILLSFIASFSQTNDVRGGRVIANQSLFVRNSWVDTIYNDTTNLNSYVRSIPTNNSVYDFVQGRQNSLNTAIAARLLKSDTAAMLSGYMRLGTGGSGGVTLLRNTGATGNGILIEIDPDDLLGFKKLIAGDNITINVGDSSLTINSTGGGGGGENFGDGDDSATGPRLFELLDNELQIRGGVDADISFFLGDEETYSHFTMDPGGQHFILENSYFGLKASVDMGPGSLGLLSDFGIGLNASYVQIVNPTTPASAGAGGVAGTIAWDTSFIYICTATNTWKRVAIATW